MGAWWGAAGVLLGYNAVAHRRGKPMACHHIRSLSVRDKAFAVLVWLWLGQHVFLTKGES
jgi:hypothetical protein